MKASVPATHSVKLGYRIHQLSYACWKIIGSMGRIFSNEVLAMLPFYHFWDYYSILWLSPREANWGVELELRVCNLIFSGIDDSAGIPSAAFGRIESTPEFLRKRHASQSCWTWNYLTYGIRFCEGHGTFLWEPSWPSYLCMKCSSH